MDRIDLLRIFARVVETTSFTRAAETLGLPRSSVSTAVQELESRLGVRLLTRTTRSVAPTPDGTAFYEHALRLVADMEEAESLFRRGHERIRGRLRVSLPVRIGRLVVAPALGDFLTTYPGIALDLGVTDRPVNLVEDGVDCALRVGELRISGMVARPLGQLTLVNVAAPAYLARHGVPHSPTDLLAEGHQIVHYASASTGRVEKWEWEDAGQTRTLDLPGRVTVDSAEAQIACCLAGLGLVQIPYYDVRPYLKTGQMVEVLPAWRAAPLPMALLYPHRRHLSARVRVFADWLQRLVAREVLHPPEVTPVLHSDSGV
ncbi:LysR family transcriptional regulator [Acetobacter sp. TBRC 12305]|uniref:LysR family transcriptional regulator n=1 Tax=Acetobacter garciniae TaxID=2817435 RepID=A0A939KKT6_9PROT|nr:LysR family transcriptional regulator [Acetobacter garciniae]MBO1323558.1 LysR family transcriptional regulator [Acetobacter garciniae]MBX0343247.1 LysR family transcriptional regulator [Acetobacter garciniae]